MANEVPGASTVILSRNLLSWTVPSENGAENNSIQNKCQVLGLYFVLAITYFISCI